MCVFSLTYSVCWDGPAELDLIGNRCRTFVPKGSRVFQTGFLVEFTVQALVSSCGTDLKYNHKVVGFSQYIYANIGPKGISATAWPLFIVACSVHSWVRLLMTFLSMKSAEHILRLCKLTGREEASE